MTFTAGGIATPADAALCMQLGADGVFVGSGIFKSADPSSRAKAIVEATTHFEDAEILARVSRGLGEPMFGLQAAGIPPRRASRDARLVGELRLSAVGRPAAHRARSRFARRSGDGFDRGLRYGAGSRGNPGFPALSVRRRGQHGGLGLGEATVDRGLVPAVCGRSDRSRLGCRLARLPEPLVQRRRARPLDAAYPGHPVRDRARLPHPRPLDRGRRFRLRVGDRLGRVRLCALGMVRVAAQHLVRPSLRGLLARAALVRPPRARRQRRRPPPLPLPVHLGDHGRRGLVRRHRPDLGRRNWTTWSRSSSG